MIRLQTLGALAVHLDDRPLTGAATQPSRLALLAVLAVAGERGVSRDKLRALFWPESSEEGTRGAFNQALYALRRDLGNPDVVTGSGTLWLNPSVVQCDLWDFEVAVRNADLQRSAALYGGVFLDGVHVASTEFEAWRDSESTRLAAVHLQVLQALAEAAERAGDPISAVHWWKRCALGDPLSAAITRKLMLALVTSGDVPSALQSAKDYAELVREELGDEPDASVVKLADRIRAERTREHPVSLEPLSAPPRTNDEARISQPVSKPHARYLRIVLSGLLGVALVALGARAYTSSSPADATLIANRVMVAPFATAPEGSREDFAGLVAADRVIQGLQQSGRVEVVDAATAFLSTRGMRNLSPERMEDIRSIARRGSAGYLVVGTVLRSADSVTYSARLVDARNGRVLQVIGPIVGKDGNPGGALDELRDRVGGAIAIELDQPIAPVTRGERPPRLDAYQQFVRGLEDFTAGRPGNGRSGFEDAVRRDPSFTLARIWLAYAVYNVGQFDTARAVVRGVAASPDRAVPVVAAWLLLDSLEEAKAPLNELVAAQRKAASLSPGSHNEWNLILYLLQAGFVGEALERLRRFEREKSWFTRWPLFHYNLASALHWTGDYQGEIDAYLNMRRSLPHAADLPHEVVGHAALGDSNTVRAKLDSAFRRYDSTLPLMLGLLADLSAVELEVHGHPSAGLSLLGWTEEQLARHASTDTSLGTRMSVLRTRAHLAFYRADTMLARETRKGLEGLLAELPGPNRVGDAANIWYNAFSALIPATCAEGNLRPLTRFADDAEQPIVTVALALCRGDTLNALDALASVPPDWSNHSLAFLRPLRGNPRFIRWAGPRDRY